MHRGRRSRAWKECGPHEFTLVQWRRYKTKRIPRLTYNEYMQSKAWKRLRNRCLRQANHKCSFCGDKAVTAHHKRYPTDFRYDKLSNLVALCWSCHEQEHPVYAMEAQITKELEIFYSLGL